MDKYKVRPYHVVMFVSRNKDNEHLENYKQRNHTFLTQKTNEELMTEFEEFVNRGITGERSRFYRSVNARKIDVVRKSLLKYLIDNEDANLANLDKLVASLAMKHGTLLTKKWLFDYDEGKDYVKFGQFMKEVAELGIEEEDISYLETPNGFAVVAEHGFDNRELMRKWHNVELKRDGMLFQAIKKKV